MKNVAKFILIGIGGFVVIFVLAMVGLWVVVSAKYGGNITGTLAEGKTFGKTTDKNGCLQEGLKRAKSLGAELKPIDDTLNKTFVNGCFETSSADAEFCKNVPSYLEEFSVSNDVNRRYEVKSCRKLGFGERHEACEMVINAKQEFCWMK